ncbi:hypothetical protein [Mesorhizobium sp.]|uniref:hypothetical protein n=1 Tax=Mesorhizobium sp. TaxID=1871066 RepID=UPI000FE5230E|nr:hypothetical protein [Mesorhizobium sp.]RWM29432.1 MAG: hypothetical protein EOR74_07065 [Mesorhizobium sp.]
MICALAPRMVLKGSDPKIISPASVVAKFKNHTFDGGVEAETLSTGRCDLLDSLPKVHDFGCRVASAATMIKQAQRPDRPLKRPKETTHYCGSYWIDVAAVMGLDTGPYAVGIFATPMKPDLEEHCDIALVAKGEAPAAGHDKDALLTEIIAELRLCLRDPKPHICECDKDLADFLGGIRLLGPGPETAPPALTQA